MKKILTALLLFPLFVCAQIDNEKLIRIADNYCKDGQIRITSESIFLNLVFYASSSTYTNTIELSLSGEILATNQFGQISSCKPEDILTDHKLGTLVLAANKNLRLHQFSREGKPAIIHEFPNGIAGRFLEKQTDRSLIAVLKKTELEPEPGKKKTKDIKSEYSQIVVFGLTDDGKVSEEFTLEKLLLKPAEHSLPVLSGNKIFYHNPLTGRLSIFNSSNGKKIKDIDMQISAKSDEKIFWDRPVAFSNGKILLRYLKAQVKPVFRFRESFIFEINDLGNKTNSTELEEIIEPEQHHDLITTTDGGFLLLVSSVKPELRKYDENMKLLWSNTYKLNKTFSPCAIQEMHDGKILMLAFTEHLGKTKPYLIVIDNKGKPITLFY